MSLNLKSNGNQNNLKEAKPHDSNIYEFEEFLLDASHLMLCRRGGEELPMTPKQVETLLALVEQKGEIVAVDALMDRLWPDAFVEESNLIQNIHILRKTLGETADGKPMIETLRRRGYRFNGRLREPEANKVVTPLENRGTFATDGSNEFWPERLESAAPTDTQPVPAPMGGKKTGSRWLFAGFAIVVVVGLVAAFAVWRNNTGNTSAKYDPISIAVLPFRPISTGERDLTYDLAFANSVIADLNQSKNLRVRSFATMRSYTDLTQDPIAIGKERGADYVLESNYLANGGRLQVTSNLFNVKTGSVDVFKYDGGDTDLYAAGRNVAAKIVPDLLARLNLAAVVPGNRGTENEEAWRSYLQGMILSNKRTIEDAERGVDEFNNAIRLDPNYALAYMGRAHALQTILVNGGERDKLCGPALEAEKRALELDPTSGDAMVLLATNRRYCSYEIQDSEREYRRAIELSPNSAHVRRFYAINIACPEGRFDEALEHLEIARELDPNQTFNEKLVGRVLFFARRYDKAIVQSIKAKELVPEAEQTSFVYMSYEMKGDLEKAFEWFLVVKQLEGESEDDLNAWRTIYAKSGWQGVLRRRLERALKAEKTADKINKRVRLLEEITTLSVQLGEYDRAFDYMAKAADSYVLFSAQMPVDPYLDPIRSDPRYKEIMARTWNSRGGNY